MSALTRYRFELLRSLNRLETIKRDTSAITKDTAPVPDPPWKVKGPGISPEVMVQIKLRILGNLESPRPARYMPCSPGTHILRSLRALTIGVLLWSYSSAQMRRCHFPIHKSCTP